MNTQETLEAFSKQNALNSGTKEALKKRQVLSTIIGIKADTGCSWFKKFVMPMGQNLLRLQLLFDICNYEIDDRKSLFPNARALGNMIALSVISLDDLSKLLGIKHQAVLAISFGRNQMTTKNDHLVLDLLKTHQPAYDTRYLQWKELLSQSGFVKVERKPVDVVFRTTLQIGSPPKQEIAVLAHLVLAMKPLAEKVNSEKFTDGDREELRRLTQVGRSFGVFELAHILGSLCGERARNQQ